MVRKAIEDIKYQGGSTLTAQAVELAIEDLKRGQRPDAIQVILNKKQFFLLKNKL